MWDASAELTVKWNRLFLMASDWRKSLISGTHDQASQQAKRAQHEEC